MANMLLGGGAMTMRGINPGFDRVRGVVTVNGTPASRPVYLLKFETLAIVDAEYSNADGTYSFDNIESGKYTVLGRDPSGTYNAIVHDHITAEPMPAPV